MILRILATMKPLNLMQIKVIEMIVGVDVGITGAISFYKPDQQEIIVYDIPVEEQITAGKTKAGNPKKRKQVDLPALKKILSDLRSSGVTVAVVEKVRSQPNDGAIQAFKFGEVYGSVNAALSMLGFEIVHCTAQSWKKHYKLIGTDKDAARLLAIDIFGPSYFKRKKDHNRADSALIACYGASLYKSKAIE
jgi:crossover junction endodeoxyribonuclease RuvC